MMIIITTTNYYTLLLSITTIATGPGPARAGGRADALPEPPGPARARPAGGGHRRPVQNK